MKIGLLPLYIKLYDDVAREAFRCRLDPFYVKVAKKFEDAGVEVVTNEFCRLKDEFDLAVKKFEENDVDCIVTIHMAYSPSLESVEALTKTSLPIVVLDTTETFDFSDKQSDSEINYCHGIHGVMDMCNLLKRAKKPYAIAAGHFDESDVFERCIGYVKAAKAATSLNGSKVGTIGGSFEGMGDFIVEDEEIKKAFGVDVVYSNTKEIEDIVADITADEISKEVESYKNDFEIIGETSEKALNLTAKTCLTVRKWIDKNSLNAFTVNFLKVGTGSGLDTMPFIEASKQMANGTGYAGEGDVLTASIVGALMKGFRDTSFIEIFCPDWKNNQLFLSHMGEMNLALTAKKPEIKEINFIYGQNAENPAVTYGCYKSGNAVFANVYRDKDGFCLLLSPVEVNAEETDNFKGNVRGWIKPQIEIDKFLEEISYAGVTHHSVLIYDSTPEQIAFFGRLLGVKVKVL